jgi:hypothetical protein
MQFGEVGRRTPMNETWKISQHIAPVKDVVGRTEILIADGWEPFAITETIKAGEFVFIIWTKKRVEGTNAKE